MTLAQKFRSGFAILTVFILVVSTNQLDKQYYDTIKTTMKSIFEDRLVAKGYLYELNTLFLQKHITVLESDSAGMVDVSQNEQINLLIDEIEKRDLTDQEELRLKSFKRQWETLMTLEGQMNNGNEREDLVDEYCDQLKNMEQRLSELAQLQIGEGESMIRSAQLSTEKNEFLSQIELILIILLGIVIQFLIFYKFK